MISECGMCWQYSYRINMSLYSNQEWFRMPNTVLRLNQNWWSPLSSFGLSSTVNSNTVWDLNHWWSIELRLRLNRTEIIKTPFGVEWNWWVNQDYYFEIVEWWQVNSNTNLVKIERQSQLEPVWVADRTKSSNLRLRLQDRTDQLELRLILVGQSVTYTQLELMVWVW